MRIELRLRLSRNGGHRRILGRFTDLIRADLPVKARLLSVFLDTQIRCMKLGRRRTSISVKPSRDWNEPQIPLEINVSHNVFQQKVESSCEQGA